MMPPAAAPPLSSMLLERLRQDAHFRRLSNGPSLRRLCSDVALVHMGLRTACLVDAFDTSSEERVRRLAGALQEALKGSEDSSVLLVRHAPTDALFVCHEESLRELTGIVIEGHKPSDDSRNHLLLPLAYVDASTSSKVGEGISATPPPSLLNMFRVLGQELSASPSSSYSNSKSLKMPRLIELQGGDALAGVALCGLLLGYSVVYNLSSASREASSHALARRIDLGPRPSTSHHLDAEDDRCFSRPPPSGAPSADGGNNLSDAPLQLVRVSLCHRPSTLPQPRIKAKGEEVQVCSFSAPVCSLEGLARLGGAGRGAKEVVARHAEAGLRLRIQEALSRLRGAPTSGGSGWAEGDLGRMSLEWLEGVEVSVESSEVSLPLVGL